jgi:hypothetical protein
MCGATRQRFWPDSVREDLRHPALENYLVLAEMVRKAYQPRKGLVNGVASPALFRDRG